jgi:hypothetical protein
MKTPLCVAAGFLAFSALGDTAKVAPCWWFEAEAHVAYTGASAPRYQMVTASGGACVADGWGGKKGHSLAYDVELTEAPEPLFVTLRYARETAGKASVSILCDDAPQGAVPLELPSTGGWGFKPESWRYASVRLPPLGKGKHRLAFCSTVDGGNVNMDGFYLSRENLSLTAASSAEAGVSRLPLLGPDRTTPLNPSLNPLPCRTPVALPYSKLKAFVDGSGLVQTFDYNPDYGGIGNSRLGPNLHVLLTGLGPWAQADQKLVCEPVPTVVTRLIWPGVVLEQSVCAAAPEERGYCVSVKVTNTGTARSAYEIMDVVGGVSGTFTGHALKGADGKTILNVAQATGTLLFPEAGGVPGPLGGVGHLRHALTLEPGQSGNIDLQFMGEPAPFPTLLSGAAKVWRERLGPSAAVTLPEATLQYAFDASVRYMLSMIEWRPDHARILKGLQGYYGSNPYDTFQVSRALNQLGLRADAEELLRHQMRHLKHDGVFEMWERNTLDKPGVEQWIVQGLAAAALWGHYEQWGQEAWLKEITPTLLKAASATLQARARHQGAHVQGAVAIEGLLPPCGGDGGLGGGYHWSQNAGPLYGLRAAAMAARRLGLAEAQQLETGHQAFREALDAVRLRATKAAGNDALPAYAGAVGDARFKSLWGVVMSVTAFDAIPYNAPAAVATLRFLQNNKQDGLHKHLGYSNGAWPYLSAEVAQWHMLLGEYEEAWTILKAITGRASSTACWYEEFAEAGCGDPCDIWSAAEQVYLSRLLMMLPKGDDLLLCAGLPVEFMAPGKKMGAKELPLPGGGTCSFSLAFAEESATADVYFTQGKQPKRLRIWLLGSEKGPKPEVRLSGAVSWKCQGRELILENPDTKVKVEVRFGR